jgi:hypothetical protein
MTVPPLPLTRSSWLHSKRLLDLIQNRLNIIEIEVEAFASDNDIPEKIANPILTKVIEICHPRLRLLYG